MGLRLESGRRSLVVRIGVGDGDVAGGDEGQDTVAVAGEPLRVRIRVRVWVWIWFRVRARGASQGVP